MKKYGFNLCAHLPLHTDTHVLTYNLVKILEIFIIAHCSIIRGTEQQKMSCRENVYRTILSEGNHSLAAPPLSCISFRHFLCQLPSPLPE